MIDPASWKLVRFHASSFTLPQTKEHVWNTLLCVVFMKMNLRKMGGTVWTGLIYLAQDRDKW